MSQPARSATPATNLQDLAATERLADQLARIAQAGDVIGLCGELGAGKTTFARAFIRARLGIEEVPSPTFTLVQTYEGHGEAIWHFDLYRIQDPAEAVELGIEEAFADAISLIEWPHRLGDGLPRSWLELRLEPGDSAESRRAELISHGQRAEDIIRLLLEADD